MSKKNEVKLPEWYKEVQTTNPKYTKLVQYGGRKYTAIQAHYQIMKATETFGLYGVGFGLADFNFDVIRNEIQKPLLMTLDAQFYYTTGEVDEEGNQVQTAFPISTEIDFYDSKGRLNSDMRKKLVTDATTKALSKIGFSADVFLGMWDDHKYVGSLEEEDVIIKQKIPTSLVNQLETLLKNTTNIKDIYNVRKRMESFIISTPIETKLRKLADDKEKILQKGK